MGTLTLDVFVYVVFLLVTLKKKMQYHSCVFLWFLTLCLHQWLIVFTQHLDYRF